MLDEPYRWVEAIRNRREDLEDQLEGASPVVGCTWADGLLLLTSTPGPRKVFEVHNEIAFAGVGHPADIEKLRKAVIDIAHVEAFNLSASDVSLQRLVNFGLGPLMKSAFDEVFRSPFIARVLVAELDAADPGQAFYTVDADGSFAAARHAAAIAGIPEAAAAIVDDLGDGDAASLNDALAAGLRSWAKGRLLAAAADGDDDSAATDAGDEDIAAAVRAAVDGGRIEAAVLDRTRPGKTKFRLLTAADLEPALTRFR